jgi:hypothetical protein
MRTRSNAGLALCAIDFLVCVALWMLLTQGDTSRPAIPTAGVAAVTTQWDGASDDDVDLWLRDPAGNLCWFGGRDAGLMHLEHDDLGASSETGAAGPNHERTVLRGILPGEYTANVHLYLQADPGPVAVTVRLWSLAGRDRILLERTLTLRRQGDEQTAFRFQLSAAGDLVAANRLPARLIDG